MVTKYYKIKVITYMSFDNTEFKILKYFVNRRLISLKDLYADDDEPDLFCSDFFGFELIYNGDLIEHSK